MSGKFSWQNDAVRIVGNNSLSRLISPTGSGKQSVFSAAAGIHSRNRRAIIAVPSVSLGEEYAQTVNIQMDTGDIIGYSIPKQLDFRGTVDSYHSAKGQDGTIRGLLAFLKDGAVGGIAVATHQTLVGAWRAIENSNEDKNEYFKNTWIGFDEAHHISGVFAENDELTDVEKEQINNNRTHLGDITKYICDNASTINSAMCAATATEFRGDKVPLFFQEVDTLLSKNTYRREFLEHWEYLGFREFTQQCMGYDDPIDALMPWLTPDACSLVYLPASNQGFRRNNPELVGRMIQSAKDKLGEDRVIDLITKDTQAKNFDKLFNDNISYKNGSPRSYEVIFAVNMFREGANYLPLNNVFDFSPSASVSRNVQSVGRLMRLDIAPDGTVRKDAVGYTAFYPNLDKCGNEEEVRQWVSDFNNTIGAGMLGTLSLFDDIKLPAKVAEYGANRLLKETFGEFSDLAQTLFIQNIEGKPTIDSAIERTIQELSQTIGDSAGWRGNIVAAFDALKKFGQHIVAMATTTEAAQGSPNSSTVPQSLKQHSLAISSIRENGFDITELRDALKYMYGADNNTETFHLLHDVIKTLHPMRQAMVDKNNAAAHFNLGTNTSSRSHKNKEAFHNRRNKHKKAGSITAVSGNIGEPKNSN